MPGFTTEIQNISAPLERDVTFTCNVKNIGQYKVGSSTVVPQDKRYRAGRAVPVLVTAGPRLVIWRQVVPAVPALSTVQVGWVKADTKAIQAIGRAVITHNQRVSVDGDFVTTFNLHISKVGRAAVKCGDTEAWRAGGARGCRQLHVSGLHSTEFCTAQRCSGQHRPDDVAGGLALRVGAARH